MFRKLIVIIISVILIAFNANAGSDGDLSLKKNDTEKSLKMNILRQEHKLYPKAINKIFC